MYNKYKIKDESQLSDLSYSNNYGSTKKARKHDSSPLGKAMCSVIMLSAMRLMNILYQYLTMSSEALCLWKLRQLES